jgi:hypothetical protein
MYPDTELYPAPYFDKKELSVNYESVRKEGFQIDLFLPHKKNSPVFGMNLAMAWPLPSSLKKAYKNLFIQLSTFSPIVYAYPYEQTHITILTLLNFKKHTKPSWNDKKISKYIPEILEIVSNELAKGSGNEYKPFTIDVGWPILFKDAAILPILNPTGEVLRLRDNIVPLLKKKIPEDILEIGVPQGIHTTVLRFLQPPTNPEKFIENFESMAKKHYIGEGVINEFLLTSETRPYMLDGERLHHFQLGEK